MAKRRKRTAVIRSQYCPNRRCRFYGKTEQMNVLCNGSYLTKTKGAVRQFCCKACGETWTQHLDTFFYDLRTPRDKVVMALKLLVKGMPLRAVAEVLEIKLDTVRGWLKRAAEHSVRVTPWLLKELKVDRVELDALWSFVKKNALRKRAGLWRERSPLGSVLPRRFG